MNAARWLLGVFLIAVPPRASADDLATLRFTPQNPSSADEIVYIGENTRWVSVQSGTIVAFEVNGRRLAWKFEGMHYLVDLNEITPPGVLGYSVVVYVGPRYNAWRGYWSGH